jgi:hypothetical protein
VTGDHLVDNLSEIVEANQMLQNVEQTTNGVPSKMPPTFLPVRLLALAMTTRLSTTVPTVTRRLTVMGLSTAMEMMMIWVILMSAPEDTPG